MAATAKSSKLGRKLDKVLFGIPENRAKFMRTGKSNAARPLVLALSVDLSTTGPRKDSMGAVVVQGPYRRVISGVPVTVLHRGRGGRVFIRAHWEGASYWGWVNKEYLVSAKRYEGNPCSPASKRAVYRLGLESARRNPGDPSAALVAAERTVIFREAALTDVAGAREFFLAGYHDGLSEERNPKGTKGEFQKCVEAVAAKGGAYDPRAVCASMEREKYGQKELTRRAVAGKKAARGNPGRPLDYFVWESTRGSDREGWQTVYYVAYHRAGGQLASHGKEYKTRGQAQREVDKLLKRQERDRRRRAARGNPRNPMDTAQEAYAGFHGEPSKKTVVIEERSHYHKYVPAAGELIALFVRVPPARREPGLKSIVRLDFSENPETGARVKAPTFLTYAEDRFKHPQLFVTGGNQSVPLELFGIDPKKAHEHEVLGTLAHAWYYTNKTHLGDEGGLAVYKHRLAEEGGEEPTVIYKFRDPAIEIAGGSYTIPNEGVRN